MKRNQKYNLDEINKYTIFNNCFLAVAMGVCDYYSEKEPKQNLALLCPYHISSSVPINLQAKITEGSVSELLNLSGVNYLTRNCTKHLTETIIEDLDNKRPVVLYIDCFFDQNSKFSFGRYHLGHYILVCDYVMKEESFLIIEHDYANENSYAYRKIKFSELEMCFYGWKRYCKSEEPTYFWFYKSDKKTYTDCLSYNSLHSEYKRSIHVLEQFFQFFHVCVKENSEKNQLVHFHEKFKEIAEQKNILASYYISEFGENDNLSEIVAELACSWLQLSDFFINNTELKELGTNISSILNLESRLHRKIEDSFYKKRGNYEHK